MPSLQITNDLNKRIKHYREQQFTGILSVEVVGKAPWYIYFLAGQIVWANTQSHAKERWHRQLSKYCPKLLNPKYNPSKRASYSDLTKLVMHKKFDRRCFSEIVAGYISENLFDIIQQGILEFQRSKTTLSYKVSARDAANFPYINLQHVHIWEKVLQSWQAWEELDLVDIQPNQVPVIVNPGELKRNVSPSLFQSLSGLDHKRQTLQDLALLLNQPLTITSLAVSILPHIRNGAIRMVEVEDLVNGKVAAATAPALNKNIVNTGSRPQKAVTSQSSPGNGEVVLYIDDSPADSQAMENIVQAAGYRYINIADPLQALPRLLEVKPQIIFLDLVMPIANGYELCAQIRRISAFANTPVIIVTNNDGIADRVRAKVVGASGFMGKPISQQRVLKVLKKYTHPRNNTHEIKNQPLNLATSAS